METISLKALAIRTLEGNQKGNSQETKSFPRDIQEGNLGKSFPVELPRVGNQETLKKKPTKAKGYGCAGCSNKIYEAVQAWEISELPVSSPWKHKHTHVVHWKCENCKTIYEIIGGTRGPALIQ